MPQSGAASQGKRRPAGRQKHVPRRTCIVCRETGAKRALTRIVRTGEGVIEVDPTGRKNGRGAYLCDKKGCWDKALSTPILARALRTTPNSESLQQLQEFAAGQHLDTGDNEPTVDSKEPAL
jgi:predicted RNA-binding protein YlxR (DUF448 family)